MELIREMDSYEEKNKFLIKIISYFNDSETKALEKFLQTCDLKKFYEELDETGIIVRIPPLWDDIAMFKRLRTFYDENDWIKPYDVYVKNFDRYIKILKPLVVGDMYILKLKQSSAKGLIARSTGSISRRGLPVKTKKPHKEPYSKTPIRIGDGENNNLTISIPPAIIAKMHLFYRSSIKGRQELGKALSKDIEGLTKMEVDETMTNRNVEILNAYFKFTGFKLQFRDNKMNFKVLNNRKLTMKEIDEGKFLVGNERDFLKEELRQEIIRAPKDLSKFKVRSVKEAKADLELKVNELMSKRYER